jgi:Phage tail tube protein
MAQRIAGTAFLKVDGSIYPLRGNLTVSPSSVERAMLAGQDYIHGYSELPRVPAISGDVSTVPELSLDTVEAVVDATVTAELANGKVYVLREACCTSAIDLNARDGMFRVAFQGVSCDEIS